MAALSSIQVCYWFQRKFETRRWPPTPFPIPFLGNIKELGECNYETVTENSQKLGGIFGYHFGKQFFIFLCDWKSMKEAMINQTEIFSYKYDLVFTKKIVGVPTLLLIDGIVYREKRRFTIHHLRNFGFGKAEMETMIKGEVTKICDILDGYTDGRKLQVKDFFFKAALNVIWGIVAGRTYDYEDKEMKNFTSVIKQFFADEWETMPLNYHPLLRIFLWWYFPVKQVQTSLNNIKMFITSQIDEHRKSIQPDQPRDYIDAYLAEIIKRKGTVLEKGDTCYQHDHLIGACIDLFQGGVETNVTTMEWALLYVSLWPEIQNKVQHELDTVIGRNRQPNYSDAKQLPYTRATILEIMRFSSIVPICSPRIAKVATTLCGFEIPKDAIVIPNLYAVNHDKTCWGDPQVFRPERFLNERGQVDKPEFLINFSTGYRVCPGESVARMEVFLMFTSLMQRYSFSRIIGESPPSLEPIISVARQPKPFHLIVQQRI